MAWETVVDVADVALYAAKRSVRDRWVVIEVREEGDAAMGVRSVG